MVGFEDGTTELWNRWRFFKFIHIHCNHYVFMKIHYSPQAHRRLRRRRRGDCGRAGAGSPPRPHRPRQVGRPERQPPGERELGRRDPALAEDADEGEGGGRLPQQLISPPGREYGMQFILRFLLFLLGFFLLQHH